MGSSGYHDHSFHMEPPTTDGQKFVGTTGCELELKQAIFTLSSGSTMVVKDDAAIKLSGDIKAQAGSTIAVASRIIGDGQMTMEHVIPGGDIVVLTSATNTSFAPNHGVLVLNHSTKLASGKTGANYYIRPPTTKGQQLRIIAGSSCSAAIRVNCSSTAGFLSKKTGFYNYRTGKTTGLVMKLTTDFSGTNPQFPSYIDLMSLSTGSWAIVGISLNSSIVDASKCYTVSSTT